MHRSYSSLDSLKNSLPQQHLLLQVVRSGASSVVNFTKFPKILVTSAMESEGSTQSSDSLVFPTWTWFIWQPTGQKKTCKSAMEDMAIGSSWIICSRLYSSALSL